MKVGPVNKPWTSHTIGECFTHLAIKTKLKIPEINESFKTRRNVRLITPELLPETNMQRN